MRWIGDLTTEEKIRRLQDWHDWFAWFPVTLGNTLNKCKRMVWLEKIERKGTRKFESNGRGGSFEYWIWEYR